ncbi:discoidin domain-containing protein [Fodinicola acaciae]|uniref:discoidin domain-containing protein n=1 Tax=Fodinicola acaciae TaxID=2681555 RepID=UPI0013D653E4|nr:discoidin domain-containing protein [Fodinicola acaciae]
MRVRAAMAAVLVVALAGCAASKVDPKASVDLHGSLFQPGGAAASGLQVGLFRTPDPAEVLTVGLTAGSALLTCLSDNGLPICKTLQQQRTDGNGVYHFRMRGDDVRGFFGEASGFSLAARLSGPSGPGLETDFQIQRTDLRMPDLTFWRPSRLYAATDGTLIWSRLTGSRSYFAEFTAGDAQVWRQPASPGDSVDPRALEDVRADFRVSTTMSTNGPDTSFDTTYRSQAIAAPAGPGAPESRGAACFVQGEKAPVRLDPCPVTNGRFDDNITVQKCESGGTSSAPPCRANTAVWIDLGASRPVGTVFARGISIAQVSVSTSDDGVHWTQRKTVRPESGFEKITLDEPVNARYVRLSGPDATSQIVALTEFSVWPTVS